jgi:hypothetical protein
MVVPFFNISFLWKTWNVHVMLEQCKVLRITVFKVMFTLLCVLLYQTEPIIGIRRAV